MKNSFAVPALAWIALTAICLILVLAGLHIALKRTGWVRSRRRQILIGTSSLLVIWTAILLVLSYRGFFSDFSKLPPRPALAIFVPLPFILWVTFSKQGTRLLRSIPQHWLVYLQSFRIAVEVLLLLAFIAGKLPVQMTVEGRNFDVITGLLAVPVGYCLATRKPFAEKLAIAFNIAGLLLLLNILIIAVLSMPTPLRYFMNEPANTLVAQFPFILLPGILVPLAYGLHIFSLRKLLAKQHEEKNDVVAKAAGNTQPVTKLEQHETGDLTVEYTKRSSHRL